MADERFKEELSEHPVTSQLDLIRSSPARAPHAVDEDQILDVACEYLLEVGLSKMTIAELARRVGVSRVTLYRRWPSVEGVIGALITREWRKITLAAYARDAAHARERIVNAAVEITRTLRTHPIQRKIIELDPEFLTPYMLRRRGTSVNFMLELLQAHIKLGQLDGSVRDGDPELVAEAVTLASWAFNATAPVLVFELNGEGPRLDELDEQMRHVLDRYLVP